MNIKQTFNRHCKTNETTCSQKGMQQELVAFLFLVIRIIIQMNHFYLQTSNVPNLQKNYSHSVTYSQNLIYSFIILPIKCAKIDQQRTYPVSYKLIKIEIYGKLSDDVNIPITKISILHFHFRKRIGNIELLKTSYKKI